MAEEPPGQPPPPVLGWGGPPGRDDPPPNRYLLRFLLGVLGTNVVGAVLLLLTQWLTRLASPDAGGVIGASAFIVIPLLMGIASAWFWKDLDLTTGSYFLRSVVNTFVALCLSYFLLREGMICLIIVSPLLLTVLFCGAIIGRALFQRPGPLRASVVPVLLALLVADATASHDYHAVVTDHLRIRARPEQVWKHVAAFGPIREEPNYWLFRIGMPRPIQTTVTAWRVGAERRCIFSEDLVFEERIVAAEPGRRLAFDIVKQPDHPEILGHLTVTCGEMTLRDNGDGTTTLIGSTAYRLHVYPAWYFDLWTRSIGRNVHWSVMRHIKYLAENPDHATAPLPVHAPRPAQARPRPAAGS